jgi:hypothetical protein
MLLVCKMEKTIPFQIVGERGNGCARGIWKNDIVKQPPRGGGQGEEGKGRVR